MKVKLAVSVLIAVCTLLSILEVLALPAWGAPPEEIAKFSREMRVVVRKPSGRVRMLELNQEKWYFVGCGFPWRGESLP